MSINDLIYANSYASCWTPVEKKKWPDAETRFLKFNRTDVDSCFNEKDPQIFYEKWMGRDKRVEEVVQKLREIGLSLFVAQIKGPYLKNSQLYAIYVLPEEYQKCIASKVFNVFNQTKVYKEIADCRFKEMMMSYALSNTHSVRTNYMAIQLNRPLTLVEEQALLPPDSANFQELYVQRLILNRKNLAFENRAGHVWTPRKISIADRNVFESDRYFYVAGDTKKEIEPTDYKGVYISKWIFEGQGVTEKVCLACDAYKIPYIVQTRSGYGSAIYLLPEDYTTLEKNGIHNFFDESKPEIEKFDPQKILDTFPSAEECLVTQELWLRLFWNALEIEHNRPLSPQERIEPAKSQIAAFVIQLFATIQAKADTAQKALAEITRLGTDHERFGELSLTLKYSYLEMKEAQAKLERIQKCR